VWGQLFLETMQAAREIDFRFFFASGTLLCYLWSAPKALRGPPASGPFPFLLVYHTWRGGCD
jgi:hypothetical protein